MYVCSTKFSFVCVCIFVRLYSLTFPLEFVQDNYRGLVIQNLFKSQTPQIKSYEPVTF